MDQVIPHRFEYVLCGIITFLLHSLLHEVDPELEIKVFFFQCCDLLQVIKTFVSIKKSQTAFYITQAQVQNEHNDLKNKARCK